MGWGQLFLAVKKLFLASLSVTYSGLKGNAQGIPWRSHLLATYPCVGLLADFRSAAAAPQPCAGCSALAV